MKSYNVAKNYKPKWTIWNPKMVSDEVLAHKRRCRRAFKQYLRTGSQKDFDRSQRQITNWDFDYKVTLIVKSDLWPEEIKATIEEAVEVECGHAVETLGCWIDKE